MAEQNALREVRKQLNSLKKWSKKKCWVDLIKTVNDDPWYKIVMLKLAVGTPCHKTTGTSISCRG